MEGAHGVLLSISGGSDLGLFEINEAASLVSDAAHADANIIFGAVIDDALGDEVRVTVIAAGFDNGKPTGTRAPAAATPAQQPPPAPPAQQAPAPVPAQTGERLLSRPGAMGGGPSPHSSHPRGSAGQNGGISVPPLPPSQNTQPPAPAPVPSAVPGGRRPLSSDDFEDELDIPEFLRSQ